jgi:hypothetical protein
MYRTHFYGDNPTHKVTIGFDDNLKSLFAIVIDLDTKDTLLDIGSQRYEIQSLQTFQRGISQFCHQLNPVVQQQLLKSLRQARVQRPTALLEVATPYTPWSTQ